MPSITSQPNCGIVVTPSRSHIGSEIWRLENTSVIMSRFVLALAVSLWWCGTAFAATTTVFNPFTGKFDYTLSNSDMGVVTGKTATFTDYDCTTFSNGGTLTTDATGNLLCSNDDTGGGGANSFETWSTPSGTNPVAESSTDTVLFTASGIVVTGTVGLDTIDFTIDTQLSELTGDVTATNAGVTTIQPNAVALSTDTTGNYVLDVADGTGIDGTAAAEGATYTPSVDATELNDVTWGDNTEVAITLTFDSTAVTNPFIEFATNQIVIAPGGSDLEIRDDIESEEATPSLKLTDDTINEDDFLWSANASQITITNDTDSVTYFTAASTHAITLGAAGAISLTVTTDGTGDAEVLLPDDSIGDAEIAFDEVTGADLTLTDAGAITSSGLITGNANLTVGNGVSAGTVSLLEGSGGGTNFKAFASPATITANTTCTFEDDANFIPDSCVGDGTDGGGGSAFTTIDVPAGTDPVATGAADTLTITETGALVITGTAATDTIDITFAAGGLTTTEISGLDISADTNLTAGDNLTLTDDDLDLDAAVTIGTSIASPIFASTTAGVAAAGILRFANAEGINWEAAPAGTDCTLLTDASEVLTSSCVFTATGGITIDATTEGNIETAIDTLANLTAASALVTVGTITTGAWNAGAITSSGIITGNANLTVGNGVSAAASPDTASFIIDNTELSSTTFGAGAFTTMTFDAGATDPVITAASGSLTIAPGGSDLIVADDVEVQDATPHLRLTDTTASEDDFEWVADASQLLLSNVTDSRSILSIIHSG